MHANPCSRALQFKLARLFENAKMGRGVTRLPLTAILQAATSGVRCGWWCRSGQRASAISGRRAPAAPATTLRLVCSDGGGGRVGRDFHNNARRRHPKAMPTTQSSCSANRDQGRAGVLSRVRPGELRRAACRRDHRRDETGSAENVARAHATWRAVIRLTTSTGTAYQPAAQIAQPPCPR